MDQTAVSPQREDWALLGRLTLMAFVLHLAFYGGYGFSTRATFFSKGKNNSLQYDSPRLTQEWVPMENASAKLPGEAADS